MAIYLVAVESTNPEESYAYLGDRLKERGDDCQTMNNLWCVKSSNDKQELFDFLSGIVNSQDKLFVAEIRGGWLTQNTKNEGDCFE